jgi:hypothetical protein
MAAPTRELEKLIVSKKLVHGGNPVTIHGIVATIMAVGRAMVVQRRLWSHTASPGSEERERHQPQCHADWAGGRDLRWLRAVSRRSLPRSWRHRSATQGLQSATAEVLATGSSEAWVTSIVVEALVSVAAAPSAPTSSHNASIFIVLGA